MSNVYIENSTLVLPSLFFDGFAWILIINWLIRDSRALAPDFNALTETTPLTVLTLQSKVRSLFFEGNLSPQNFHPRQISLWQHDGLAILFCCRFNRGSGEKLSQKTRQDWNWDDEGQFEVKVYKNHQIIVLENHQKNLEFRAKKSDKK